MREYGVSVADKTSKDRVDVYFTPMTYVDWCTYNTSTESYDNASIRYLFKKYVRSAVLKKSEGDTVELGTVQLCALSPSVLKEIVDKMILKAGFSAIDEFVTLLNQLERNASTLPGAYDLFIYLNTSIDVYVSFLEKTMYERAAFIATLEKVTAISVKDRFDLSLEVGCDLDLITPPTSYRPKSKGKAVTSLRDKFNGTDVSEEQIEAFEESSRSLRDELRRGRSQQKRQSFDWTKDNQELETFSNDPGM